MTASPPLLVPVTVDAMVHNAASTNFIRGTMNYAQLANWMPPEPAAFQSDEAGFSSDPRHQGVYVMWSLPEALRRGAQQADGSFQFPCVPDRWLVVRHYWPASAGSTPQATSWVVESDFLDAKAGTSAYLDPTATTATPTAIGRKTLTTLSNPWKEPGAPAKPFLTAVSESCPAFAAYQPFNENVFSIFDDLAAGDDPTQKLPAGTLSYFVLGWYADPAADLLAKAPADAQDFAALLKSLGWSASANTASTASSVYHGAANGVLWQPGGPAPASPSDGAMPQIALGSTGIDGLVAFARSACNGVALPDGQTPDQVAELIEAFQYDVMDKLALSGADDIVEQEIRARWYQSTDGGIGWTITGAPAAPGAAAKPPPPLSPAETAWLADLNQAQQDFDTAARTLAGARRDLYEMWWKWGAAKTMAVQGGGNAWPWSTSDAAFKAAIDTLSGQASAAAAVVTAKFALIPHADATQTLSEAAAAYAKQKSLRAELTLKPVAEPRYWMPVDPVAVVSNTAHLLKIGGDATLSCRWSAEVVSVIDAGTATVSATAMAPMLPALAWAGLPEPGAALFAEFFLLDPTAAAAASVAAGASITASAIAQCTAEAGVAPALRQAWPWAQAWRPLFMDWMIEWSAIPFESSGGTANWAFNGLDYDLVEGFSAAGTTQSELSGRAILSPKPSFEFKGRLDQFLKDHADSPEAKNLGDIEALLQSVEQWDFLSQTLGGLNTLLGKRNPVGSSNPDASVSPLIGRDVGPPPRPHLSAAGRGPPPASAFEGLRAGQFYVNRVSVVDAFGQTIEAVRPPLPPDTFPRTQNNAVFHPLLDDGVAPTQPLSLQEPARFVQLPPRLLQPARLNFRFDAGAGGNAISGWILPDHLDQSLMVYSADGSALGSLARATDASGAAEMTWTCAPGSPYADGPEGFKKMVAEHDRIGAVLGQLSAAGPEVFAKMVQVIDETLWSIDPLGRRSDAFLSVLVGRPLAVVAASLSLELQAPALRDPDWPYTFQPAEPRMLSYQFPVRLGDLGYHQDGLIGYFLNRNYDQFNALHLPDEAQQTYFKAVAEGNYVPLALADGGPGPAADLTLLVDPRGSIHAQCAIVPMKAITLPPYWVDSALAAMTASFPVGPLLLETRAIPSTQTPPADVQALVLNPPAEQQGAWTWFERDQTGNWMLRSLTAADGKPVFPDSRPTLRDGVLQLNSAMGNS